MRSRRWCHMCEEHCRAFFIFRHLILRCCKAVIARWLPASLGSLASQFRASLQQSRRQIWGINKQISPNPRRIWIRNDSRRVIYAVLPVPWHYSNLIWNSTPRKVKIDGELKRCLGSFFRVRVCQSGSISGPKKTRNASLIETDAQFPFNCAAVVVLGKFVFRNVIFGYWNEILVYGSPDE